MNHQGNTVSSTTTITPTDSGVVINQTGATEFHLHLSFTVVAATSETLDKIAAIQSQLKGSDEKLETATAAAA